MIGKTERLTVTDTGASTDNISGFLSIDSSHQGDVVLVQLELGGANQSAQIEGRMTPNASWVPLLDSEVTENAIRAVAAVPQIRLNVSAGTGVTDAYVQ